MTARILYFSVLLLAAHAARADIPNRIAHQGRIVVDNANFQGNGSFKFLLYSAAPQQAVWSNASTSPAGLAEPASAVSIQVNQGLYTIFLGDPTVANMAALPDSIEPPAGAKLFLRTWFDAGTGFQQLAPDRQVSPAAFALHARQVAADGVGSDAIADGAVTAAKIAGGAVSQLGRPDGSDLSAVQVTDQGAVGIGTVTPLAGLQVSQGVDRPFYEPTKVLRDGVDGFDTLQGPTAIAVSGNLFAVAAGSEDSVVLIDITDPANPVLRSTLTDGTTVNGFLFDQMRFPRAVAISGNLLAIAGSGDDAVSLVNISDPSAPVLRSVLRDGNPTNGFQYDDLEFPRCLAFLGNLLCIASADDDAVTLVDVSDPAAPVLRSTLKDGAVINGFLFDDMAFPECVAAGGNLLAISSDHDGAVTLVDITNPSAPILRSVLKDGAVNNGFLYEYLDNANPLAISGGLLAIGSGDTSSTENAVSLVDVTDPAAPVLRVVIRDGETVNGTRYDKLDSPSALAFNGTLLAMAADEEDAITFVDISNPGAPVAVQQLVSGVDIDDFRVLDSLAFRSDLLAVAALSSHAVALLGRNTAPAGLVIDHRVGIGTTAPQAALHVAGDFRVDFARQVTLHAEQVSLGRGSATGANAIAAGLRTKAEGETSTALGFQTTAGGSRSTALGSGTIAGGDRSTALGSGSEASGADALATGANTRAAGNASATLGVNTLAPSYAELALGANNTDYIPDGVTTWHPSDRLLVIGNGTSNFARSDLLTLLKNGAMTLDGSMTSTGAMTASDFRLPAPRAFVHRVAAGGFTPEHGETFARSTGYILPAGGDTEIDLHAAVQLPQGATVTGVDFMVVDNDPAEDLAVINGSLSYVSDTSTTTITMADTGTRSTSGTSAVPSFIDDLDGTVIQPVIDNQSRQYSLFVRLSFTAVPAGSTLRFYGARISYTLDTLRP